MTGSIHISDTNEIILVGVIIKLLNLIIVIKTTIKVIVTNNFMLVDKKITFMGKNNHLIILPPTTLKINSITIGKAIIKSSLFTREVLNSIFIKKVR